MLKEVRSPNYCDTFGNVYSLNVSIFKTCSNVLPDNVTSTKPLKTVMLTSKNTNSCGIIVAKGKKTQKNPNKTTHNYFIVATGFLNKMSHNKRLWNMWPLNNYQYWKYCLSSCFHLKNHCTKWKLTPFALQATVHYEIIYQYQTTTAMFDQIAIPSRELSPNNKNNGKKQQLKINFLIKYWCRNYYLYFLAFLHLVLVSSVPHSWNINALLL